MMYRLPSFLLRGSPSIGLPSGWKTVVGELSGGKCKAVQSPHHNLFSRGTFQALLSRCSTVRMSSTSLRNNIRVLKLNTVTTRSRPLSFLFTKWSFKQLCQNLKGDKAFLTTKVRFDLNKNLPQDVLVYSHKNDNFYRILSYFGVFQMFIWGYVALFSFQQLKNIPVGVQDTSQLPWWKKFIYKEGQYKNALSILSLFVGVAVLFITLTYPRRAVRSLWLLKGGDKVEISTYSWMGKTESFQRPVDQLSCNEGRTGAGNHVPLKVKNKSFFFLLDKQGTFHNTDLFDFVVGLKRNL